MLGLMPAIPALYSLRQEDLKFWPTQGKLVRLCLKNKIEKKEKG
jgi:hypothetical protein